MKRAATTVWRILVRCLLGFLISIATYSLLMFVLSRITVEKEAVTETPTIAIYIKTNGVHSDLVVPYRNIHKDWSALLPSENTTRDDADAAFLSVGWGDRDFYLYTPTWADLKVSTALKAACYMGTSVMHIELYDTMTEGEACRKILLTEGQYIRLISYIEGSLRKSTDGVAVVIPGAAYGDYDAFYEGVGRYSAAYTCNSWVNEGLKAAGQTAALWTLTDTGIFCHY